jgi:hypothetical protein
MKSLVLIRIVCWLPKAFPSSRKLFKSFLYIFCTGRVTLAAAPRTQAIEFAKEQNDQELWTSLIDWAIDKPGMGWKHTYSRLDC